VHHCSCAVVLFFVPLFIVLSMGNYAAKDTEQYRTGYPGLEDDPNVDCNLRFYRNELASRPQGALIDEIHRNWKGDYRLLESHHGFIQWLFPIRENGMNYEAKPLQLHEMESITGSEECRRRVVLSYRLMLDFYGFKLDDEDSGTVSRSENYKSRFQNLSYSSHNWLRVTRILKSLGELGFEHYKLPWLMAICKEVFDGEAPLRACQRSFLSFWSWTLRKEEDQKKLQEEIVRHGYTKAKDVEL